MSPGATTCTQCGQSVQADAAPQNIPQAAPVPPPQVASLLQLQCPACGSYDLLPTGVKGSAGKAVATTLAFGAIGNLVAGSVAQDNLSTTPIQYRCSGCKNKFEAAPGTAGPEEMLGTPATIDFERMGSFVGGAVPQIVYLNGVKVGPVKNGKRIQFQTLIRPNTLFVTDHHGMAFPSVYRFEAQPGGMAYVRFNRKFL